MAIEERVSQEVSAPFCVLPLRSPPGSPWPFLALLTIAGVGAIAFGIWDLIVSLPEYSVAAALILIGSVLLWFAHRVFRTIDADGEYWLGVDHERFVLHAGATEASWLWVDVGSFRVTETVNEGFVEVGKGPGLDEEVNFVQTTSITLCAEAREGPPISIPFDIFLPEGRARDQAENFGRFLNDLRQRGKNGGLVRGAPPFLAPIELAIVPMRYGAPVSSRRPLPRHSKSVIQRQG